MKKIKQVIRDVYDPTPPDEIPETGLSGLPPELLEAAILRYRILTGLFIVLLIVLLFVLGHVLTRPKRVPAPPVEISPSEKLKYVPYYTLPKEALWVMQYEREHAEDLYLQQTTNQPVSVDWVKTVAYHLIVGQQAMKAGVLDKATVHFEQALTIFPELRGIHGLVGTLYLQQQQFARAVSHLEAALKEHPSYAVLNNLGTALMTGGFTEEAERCLLEAQKMNPDHPGSYKNLALLYKMQEKHEQAIASFKQYFVRHDQDTEAMQLYAEYLISLDKREQAIEFLKAGCQAHPEDALPLYLLLATIEARDRNETAAIEALKQATHLISPNLALTELNRQEFDAIRDNRAFQSLVRNVELATVSPEAVND